MYCITLLVIATGKTFTKTYDEYYWYEKDLIKYQHSKKLRIISHWEEK